MQQGSSNMVMEKFNSLSLAEKLVLSGGMLMLIASFLTWFHISVNGLTSSGGASGWGGPGSIWSFIAIAVALLLAGIIVATRFGNMAMPALPQNVTWGKLFGGGAAVIIVAMLLKAIAILTFSCGTVLAGLDCGGGFGLGFFLGVIAAGAIAYGGFLLFNAEKTGMPSQ